jgi:hypothetical protein
MNRRRLQVLGIVALTLVLTGCDKDAPQLIDASEDGPLAFVFFALMCFLFVGLLFLIDKVRQRAEDEQDRRESGGR